MMSYKLLQLKGGLKYLAAVGGLSRTKLMLASKRSPFMDPRNRPFRQNCCRMIQTVMEEDEHQTAGLEQKAEVAHKETIDWIQSAFEALNKDKYPVGELSLEEFLQIEDDLRNISVMDESLVSKTSIQQSFRMFNRLLLEHQANPDLLEEYEMAHWLNATHPRATVLLNELLQQWMYWLGRLENPQEEELSPHAVLDVVQTLRSNHPDLRLTDTTYRFFIYAVQRSGNRETAALFADNLLEKLLEESLKDHYLRPSGATIRAVLRTWAVSPRPEAPEKVDSLFHTLCKLYEDCISEYPPDNLVYMSRLHVWANSGRRNAPQKVDEVLESMKTSPFEGVAPEKAAYRVAIHSWLNSREPKATDRATKLFEDIVQKYMASGDEDCLIDADFFSAMIATLAKQGHCDKAEEIFHLMEEINHCNRRTKDDKFEPSTKCLLGMVIAYARSGAIEKAESILLHLDDMAQSKVEDEDLPPKRSYYHQIVNALGKSSLRDGADRGEKLLSRMVKHHRAGVPNMLPDSGFFDSLIIAWSKSKSKEAPTRAEGLIRVMQQIGKEPGGKAARPTEKTYFMAMTAWARSKDPTAPDRAEKLFFEMLEQYNNGDATMKPSKIHYTTVMDAWARSGHPDAPLRAQQAFEAVVSFYEEGDKAYEPDSHLYTALMKAWASAGDANSVEAVFLQLFEAYSSTKRKKLMPSTMTFNILLEAWIKSRHPEAHKKATLVYGSMVEFTEEGTLNVPPDLITYTQLIELMAYSRLPDAAQQAEKYLELMKAAPLPKGQYRVFLCYLHTIGAWRSTPGLESAAKVEALVNEVMRLSKSGKIPPPSRSEHLLFLKTIAGSEVEGMALRAKQALELGEEFKTTRDLLPPALKKT